MKWLGPTFALIFVLLCVAVATAYGQSSSVPSGSYSPDSISEAPSVIAKNGAESSPAARCNTTESPLLCAAPVESVVRKKELKQTRTADKNFWFAIGASTALWLLDAELTNSCVQSGQCRELNWIYGRQPGRG